ncbi:MAG: MmgE/PrpD family protein [Streptosporangiales bacterium]|nr:MmgE/PrpD family protein [Streptosporangiales bacterium]
MDKVAEFIRELRFHDLPPRVVEQAQLCLLDLVGVAAAGTNTQLSRIIRDHAAGNFAAGTAGARILFDGRRVSPVGAALASGMTIDSLDAHDGHALAKGHAGAAVLPAVLALVDGRASIGGPEFLATLVLGYEIGIRAGIALHATAPAYHSSGAWNALACAAVGARRLTLNQAQTEHALGIAEYHGPRSPMMRCIDHPTMVKDGSGWGAMAGVSAALLAEAGFTGAPAATVAEPPASTCDTWSDLGDRWRILEQYFKPQPVCRWAQPAVRAALDLREHHRLTAEHIEHVEVVAFHEAVRLGARNPTTTEEAQYSLPFAVATALCRGEVAAADVALRRERSPDAARLSATMTLTEGEGYNRRFPAERCAAVHLRLRDGRRVTAAATTTPGDPTEPLGPTELEAKYRRLSVPPLSEERSARLAAAVRALPQSDSSRPLLEDLLAPPPCS